VDCDSADLYGFLVFAAPGHLPCWVQPSQACIASCKCCDWCDAGITSHTAAQPQALRLIRHTSVAQAAAGVAAADEAIVSQLATRQRAQTVLLTVAVATIAVAVCITIARTRRR